MQSHHWLMFLVILVVGMLLQRYLDPLAFVGLGE